MCCCPGTRRSERKERAARGWGCARCCLFLFARCGACGIESFGALCCESEILLLWCIHVCGRGDRNAFWKRRNACAHERARTSAVCVRGEEARERGESGRELNCYAPDTAAATLNGGPRGRICRHHHRCALARSLAAPLKLTLINYNTPPPSSYMPPYKKLLAYAIGLTSGCGAASKVVKCGTMSSPLKRMNAPLLPIWSQ